MFYFVFVAIATVEVELDKRKSIELRTIELDHALRKPKTTVIELRALERCKLSMNYVHFSFSFYMNNAAHSYSIIVVCKIQVGWIFGRFVPVLLVSSLQWNM